MALQTSVQLRNPIALPGNVVGNSKFTRINSYAAGTAGAPAGDSGLYLGQAAFYDTASLDYSAVVPGEVGSTAAEFAGFVTRNAIAENAIGAGFTILNGVMLGILDQGNMYALCETAMAVTDPVHIIINNADPTKIGRITNAAVGADVIDISAYVKLKGYTAAPFEIVEISISKV